MGYNQRENKSNFTFRAFTQDGGCRLSIEDADPFQVEWTSVGAAVGVARLTRGETEAILFSVVDAAGAVDATTMRSLHTRLTEAFECAGLNAAFDWLLGNAPPLAALAYVNGPPQIGMDTLAMCVAAASGGA